METIGLTGTMLDEIPINSVFEESFGNGNENLGGMS